MGINVGGSKNLRFRAVFEPTNGFSTGSLVYGIPTCIHTSTTHRNPILPVELSGEFEFRAATRYRLQYDR